MKKSKNIFWGIFFIFSAISIIILQVGNFQHISIPTIILTFLFLSLLIQGLCQKSFVMIFLPIALLYNIYQKPFQLPHINSFLLCICAIFLGLGFSMLFKQKNKFPHHFASGDAHAHVETNSSDSHSDEDYPVIRASFGGSTRYLHSSSLQEVTIDVSFGAAEVYFSDTTLSPEGAHVRVNASFAGVELHVPRDWSVTHNLNCVFGGVDFPPSNSDPSAPCLHIYGDVSFGGLDIKYI